jgi:hypothetical protein
MSTRILRGILGMSIGSNVRRFTRVIKRPSLSNTWTCRREPRCGSRARSPPSCRPEPPGWSPRSRHGDRPCRCRCHTSPSTTPPRCLPYRTTRSRWPRNWDDRATDHRRDARCRVPAPTHSTVVAWGRCFLNCASARAISNHKPAAGGGAGTGRRGHRGTTGPRTTGLR